MTPTPQVELFSFWRTGASYRVRVAFNLKRVSAQERNINIGASQHCCGDSYLRDSSVGHSLRVSHHGRVRAAQGLCQR